MFQQISEHLLYVGNHLLGLTWYICIAFYIKKMINGERNYGHIIDNNIYIGVLQPTCILPG